MQHTLLDLIVTFIKIQFHLKEEIQELQPLLNPFLIGLKCSWIKFLNKDFIYANFIFYVFIYWMFFWGGGNDYKSNFYPTLGYLKRWYFPLFPSRTNFAAMKIIWNWSEYFLKPFLVDPRGQEKQRFAETII